MAGPEITHIRLDLFPDGGMARVLLWGDLSAAGRGELAAHWYDLLPTAQVRSILTSEVGMSAQEADMAINLDGATLYLSIASLCTSFAHRVKMLYALHRRPAASSGRGPGCRAGR